MPRPVPDFSYRSRSRDGLVFRKPRRLNLKKAREIRRRYFRREATQLELALDYGVTQPTIARVVANMVYTEPEV
jgi:hypothetical protein